MKDFDLLSPEIQEQIQIIEKEYSQKFIKENVKNKILAVAICYDSKTKEHQCLIEKQIISQDL